MLKNYIDNIYINIKVFLNFDCYNCDKVGKLRRGSTIGSIPDRLFSGQDFIPRIWYFFENKNDFPIFRLCGHTHTHPLGPSSWRPFSKKVAVAV